jgi:Zn-dependent protease
MLFSCDTKPSAPLPPFAKGHFKMIGTGKNAIRLFQFKGIDVFLHWSWFLVAAYEIGDRQKAYASVTWNILEYLALFLIVMLHEFGHALACRQVGGEANKIVLWPLGGVAYVNPPQRAGATLWSIAAGPLVNVGLVPIFLIIGRTIRALGLIQTIPDAYLLLKSVAIINIGLLIFNLLPVYPLDGGQILRALLWYPMGRARSLMAATIVGFLGVAALALYALRSQSIWLAFVCAYVFMNCWRGMQQARALLKIAKLQRHPEYSCPSCKISPPVGEYWKCSLCARSFDTFQSQAVCPHCSTRFPNTACMDCRRAFPISEWTRNVPVATSI